MFTCKLFLQHTDVHLGKGKKGRQKEELYLIAGFGVYVFLPLNRCDLCKTGWIIYFIFVCIFLFSFAVLKSFCICYGFFPEDICVELLHFTGASKVCTCEACLSRLSPIGPGTPTCGKHSRLEEPSISVFAAPDTWWNPFPWFVSMWVNIFTIMSAEVNTICRYINKLSRTEGKNCLLTPSLPNN